MITINPYIHFNGNAEEAFTFYQSVLGGDFNKLTRYSAIASAAYPIPEAEQDKIMHIGLQINESFALMGSDTLEIMGQVSERANRHTIFMNTQSRAEADTLFKGLSAGGTVEMPINDGPSGNYFGMFADKFGVQWMVNLDVAK